MTKLNICCNGSALENESQREGNKRFSIITVCLNAKQAVLETAVSIENQTSVDFEWIVIDGGSDDGTAEFLADNPIVSYFVTEKDSGIFDAMNKGIRQATGEYCLFLNAGDCLSAENVLEKTARHLGCDLVVGQLFVVAPDNLKKNGLRKYERQCIDSMDYLYHRSLPHQATFIRKTLFEKHGNYDVSFRLLGDHDFFARVLTQNTSFSFLDFCISNYPLDGISSQLKGSSLYLQELKSVRRRNFPLSFRARVEIANILNLFRR